MTDGPHRLGQHVLRSGRRAARDVDDGGVHEAVWLLQRSPLDYPRDRDGAERALQLVGYLVTSGFDVGRVAIGQGGAEGQDLTTPMQMAEVAATVANGGKLMQPTFVQQVTDPDGRVTQKLSPHVQSTPISPQTASELTTMMTHVTQDPQGTAAGLSVSGNVPFAGKTGTAEISGSAQRRQPALVHCVRAGDEPASRGRGDDRALSRLLRCQVSEARWRRR